MLSITKNRPKSSMATVKFISSKPKKNSVVPRTLRQNPQIPTSTIQNVTRPTQIATKQSLLTEQTFQRYLVGYVQIFPSALPKTVGNKIRYAIDTVDYNGRIVSTVYRLGGFVKSVSPDLSVVTLYNPYAKKQWNLTVKQPAGKRLRLYYARRNK